MGVTQNTSTEISIDSTDDGGNSINSFLQTILSVTSAVKGFVRISEKFNTDNYILWNIDDLTNNTGWWLLEVGAQASSDTNPFSNSDDVIVSFVTTGDRGDDGTSGSSGTSGDSGTSGSSGTSGDSGTSGSSGTSGDSGTSGSSGTSGVTIISPNTYPFEFLTTTATTPVAGQIRGNNVQQNLNTNLIIYNEDADGNTIPTPNAPGFYNYKINIKY